MSYKRREPSPRQRDLDSYAARNGWDRGPFKSWHKGPWTIAVWSQGGFVAVERATKKPHPVASLAELDSLVRFA